MKSDWVSILYIYFILKYLIYLFDITSLLFCLTLFQSQSKYNNSSQFILSYVIMYVSRYIELRYNEIFKTKIRLYQFNFRDNRGIDCISNK